MKDADREAVLAALLAQHDDAYISAINSTGLFAELPVELRLTSQRLIRGVRSGLDLVVPDDQRAVAEAWYQVLETGAANCAVHLKATPEQVVRLHFVDVRHRYGVLIAMITGATGHFPAGAMEAAPVRPRLVTIRKDPAAVVTDADPAIEAVLGWTAAELAGRRSLDLVHPDDHQRAIASWIDLLSAPAGAARRVRLRHLHRDGHAVWFEVTNHSYLTDPQTPHVVAEMLDISDEMAAQEALRANEQMLSRLTEALPLGVLQIDGERRVVYQNSRLAQAVDVRVGERIRLDTLLPADRRAVDAALTAVLTRAEDADLEFTFHRTSQGTRRASAGLRALTTDTGEVTGAIICLADITEDARMRDELRHRATYDELTGCLNRASTLTALSETLGRPDHRGTAVMFVDLDEFKAVNDRLGHAAGDQLLTFVAGQLRSAVRERDLIGRFGGDEFVVVCRDVADSGQARRIAEALIARLRAATLTFGGEQLSPQASVGVTWTAAGPEDAESVIARADTAMYEAKRRRAGHTALAVG